MDLSHKGINKKLKVATGTLKLFDTSGVDHDGTGWKPPREYASHVLI
jgi:hypothetical protein